MAAVSEPASRDEVDRHIHGSGTLEATWRAWDGLSQLAPLTLDELVPPGSRAVVVAPHPDDEVLGCGGALTMLARAGRDVLVIGLTDGEASHPGSARWPPERLGARRREERLEGLRRLGVTSQPSSLFVPDGGVLAAGSRLPEAIDELLLAGDVVITTWRLDGHPDHEAAGRASALAARRRGCRCWEMPVWTWHWARPDEARVPWRHMRRLELDDRAVQAKRQAIAAHTSQLRPVAGENRPAVLPDWALARLMRTFETFIDSEATA